MSSGGKLLSHSSLNSSASQKACAEAAIKIEPANWRDFQAIRTLEQEAYTQDAYPFLEVLGMLTLPGFIRIKAVAGDQLAGFAVAEGYSDSEYDWITVIRVSQAYQRCGIGTSLMLECEKQLKKKTIRLCVRRSNLPAIQLYIKCGYQQATVWNSYYHDSEDAIIMEKSR